MPEAVAPDRAGILSGRSGLLLVGLVGERLLVVLLLFLGLGVCEGVAVAVYLLLVLALVGGDQLGQHPGERVDLVAAERRTGLEVRLGIVEHALESEHQAVADLPLRRGRAVAGLDLGEGVVKRASSRRAGCEHLGRILAVVHERLSGPRFRANGRGGEFIARLRESRRLLLGGFLHVRSTDARAATSKRWTRSRIPWSSDV